jgi:hypothetical protein
MQINSVKKVNFENKFMKLAERNYGRQPEWTQALKATMRDPKAIIVFQGKNWVVTNNQRLYSPSIKLHFYDRFVHIVFAVLFSTYAIKFNRGAKQLSEAYISYKKAKSV